MLTAGRFGEHYDSQVLNFDWSDFFQHRNGGATLEDLRRRWLEGFDVTLIDSRTGITDSGGVCTVQMPDVLVPVFGPNRQSLDGTKQVVIRAMKARQELAYDRTRFLVFPLLSRFDSRTEYRESQVWLKLFAEELKDFYSDWLPKNISPLQVLERTKLPYIAFFSFGEKLPVVAEGTTDPESLGFAYQNAATLIAEDFQDAGRILQPISGGTSLSATTRKPVEVREWTSRIDRALTAVGFSGKPSFGLSAVPVRGIDIPELIRSRESSIVKLLEHPPTFRLSGFDLRVGEPAQLYIRA